MISQTPFIVAYRVSAEQIEILAVIHGARQWPTRSSRPAGRILALKARLAQTLSEAIGVVGGVWQ